MKCTYSELCHISSLKEREEEKKNIESEIKALMKKADKIKKNSEKAKIEISLRDDKVEESKKNLDIILNAPLKEDGFILVREDFYGGEN